MCFIPILLSLVSLRWCSPSISFGRSINAPPRRANVGSPFLLDKQADQWHIIDLLACLSFLEHMKVTLRSSAWLCASPQATHKGGLGYLLVDLFPFNLNKRPNPPLWVACIFCIKRKKQTGREYPETLTNRTPLCTIKKVRSPLSVEKLYIWKNPRSA